MDRQTLVPLSILAGCALIAVATYFGLRSSQQKSTPSAGVADSQPSVPPQPSPPATNTPASASALEKAARDAKSALAAEKEKTFVPKCWRPLLAKKPQPARAKLTVGLAFNPQGKEIARSISEHREAERADVAQCLRELPIGITIPAPGVPVPNIDVEMEFP